MNEDSQLASEHELAEHIRAERVRFVFIQSALPIVFSPLAAIVLSLTLWNAVDQRLLTWWTAGLVALCVLRIGTNLGFARAVAGEREIRRWERIFIASIMLVDLWWGFGSLVLLSPQDVLIVDAVVFAFVMLMAGGHAASYAAHPFTVLAGVLCLVVPITVDFALRPDTFHRAMAFVSVMFVAASMRSIRTLGYFFGRTHRLAHELKLEKARAEEVARTDFLTGLQNRRAFYEEGERLLHALVRGGRPAVLMIDIDHFKAINDRHGHAGGDAALRALAELLRAQLPSGAVPGRLGGEEFALLLPDSSMEAAMASAERMRAATEALVVEFEGQQIRFTVSMGVAAFAPGDTLDGWIARADAALYRSKQEGRNRVIAEVA
jgi:diguanylate cyclase (GGDEF)-like protein